MNFIQTNWMLILVLFASGAMLIWPMAQRRFGPAKDIGTVNAVQLINHRNALVLDVRETAEYDGGHVPNAVHIPLSQLGSRGGELARHVARPIVACCASGNRSRSAANALSKLGFQEIYNLQGGYRAWKDAGLPTEK